MTPIYDICGIGIGPFNLSLAALAAKKDLCLSSLFLEAKSQFDWHPGLMLQGSKLQVPFLADLVTMTDPTNPYSFLNYLAQHNRLYKFYFLEDVFLYRKEYEIYCKWVASKLTSCQFDRNVSSVEFTTVDGECVYRINAVDKQQNHHHYYARNIVLGVGSTPSIPACVKDIKSERIFHTSQFLNKTKLLHESKKIAVIGSGQSAAECVLSLLQNNSDNFDNLYWLTRSNGFFPMEASGLGLEHFSPDYMSYFYELDNRNKLKYDIIKQQQNIYKGISLHTLRDIYHTIYQLTFQNEAENFKFTALQELQTIETTSAGLRLHLKQVHHHEHETLDVDTVILGTGYEFHFPLFLNQLRDNIKLDEHQYWTIDREFKLDLKKPDAALGDIYIQNGEIYSHGIGAPDLGLGAYRAAKIINSIYGSDVYNVPDKAVFQSWGAVALG